MKIVTVPHPALRKISKPIDTIDKKIVTFIQELENTLRLHNDPPGVGLSAPQVAKNLRVFCTFLKHKHHYPEIRTYINPEITKASDQMTLGPNPDKPILEGCLSIPDLYGPVPRHQWIKLSYYTLDARRYTLQPESKRFSSFPARVIQHELDHLNGILFTDHAIRAGLPLYQEQNGNLTEVELV